MGTGLEPLQEPLPGTTEICRRASAYAVSVAFCLTYLLASLLGASPMDALLRGAVVAGSTLLISGLLARPAVDAVLAAMARDRAIEAQKQQEEAE